MGERVIRYCEVNPDKHEVLVNVTDRLVDRTVRYQWFRVASVWTAGLRLEAGVGKRVRSLRGPAYLRDHWRPDDTYVGVDLRLGCTLCNHPEAAIKVRDLVVY